jgi:Protein of unknown function (DUF3311)
MKTGAHPPRAAGRRNGRTPVRYPIVHPSYVLLLLPFIGLLWPAWYAREAPEIWHVPFFYWYQLAWLILTAILTQVVFVLVRGGW